MRCVKLFDLTRSGRDQDRRDEKISIEHGLGNITLATMGKSDQPEIVKSGQDEGRRSSEFDDTPLCAVTHDQVASLAFGCSLSKDAKRESLESRRITQ